MKSTEEMFTPESDLLSKLFYNYKKELSLNVVPVEDNILCAVIELGEVSGWKNRLGFDLQIMPNDHFENGLPHIHFYNKDNSINIKIDFRGNLLKGDDSKISRKVRKELISFLQYEKIQETLKKLWNKNNPHLLLK